jgi:hypothetical protein
MSDQASQEAHEVGAAHAVRGSVAPKRPPHITRAAVVRNVTRSHSHLTRVCALVLLRRQIMDDIGDYLRYLFQTDSKYTAAISGCVRGLGAAGVSGSVDQSVPPLFQS